MKIEKAKISEIIDCVRKNYGYERKHSKGKTKKQRVGFTGRHILSVFQERNCTSGNVGSNTVLCVWKPFTGAWWYETKKNKIVKVFILDEDSERLLKKKGFFKLRNANVGLKTREKNYLKMERIIWKVYQHEKGYT